ncbi:MAG: hypothetical protein DDT37_00322 [Firmicutes bacterium]|nr:hypothetical protein [candidate division NPL-UPA2 bacterium]
MPGNERHLFAGGNTALMQRQRRVEYFHCSSDPQSLDGLVIPELGVAFVVDSLMQRCQRVLVLQADKGTGAEYVLEHLMRAAAARHTCTPPRAHGQKISMP